ncbi:DUF4142 domain-containing protein, partial [Anaeromyxobacter terrae]|uniref:DUF4142 domain-containing protein n=1 Tax=Anaeromyxobacter terrae TaxID=2925406 RepID=UPI001F5740AE
GGAAYAQVPRWPPPAPAQRPDGSPRPAPAPPQHPGAAPPAGAAQQIDARQKQIYGTLEQRSREGQELGHLAQERGASSQVKDLGKKLVDDHARVERELAALFAERGGKPKDTSGPKNEREAHDAMMKQLRGLSGADFDHAFLQQIEFAQRGHRADLQRWRDETPGADARLKKWLSDTEVLAESDLLASRNAISALGMKWEQDPRHPERAAGRTPPRVPGK